MSDQQELITLTTPRGSVVVIPGASVVGRPADSAGGGAYQCCHQLAERQAEQTACVWSDLDPGYCRTHARYHPIDEEETADTRCSATATKDGRLRCHLPTAHTGAHHAASPTGQVATWSP